jgi:hypothetical protein
MMCIYKPLKMMLMNKQYENKLVMMKVLMNFLKQNQSLWQDSAPIAEAVGNLEELIAIIELTRRNTAMNQSGLVALKKTLKTEIVKMAFHIGSQMFALASKTKDQILKGKVGLSKSELEAQRDGELASTCKSIADLCRIYLAALAVYDITENELTEFETLIATYENSVSSPRSSVSERKANNVKLKVLFADSKVLLNEQLKRLMTRYETSNPEFYTGYLNAATVVDYGIRHEKPETPVATD